MTDVIPLIAGFVAGAAGAMGLGGGFVLILYLNAIGMNTAEIRAANLLFFIPTALVSMSMNRRGGLVDARLLPYAAAAGSIGAVVGLLLGSTVDESLLRKVFAVLLVSVGVRELFHRKQVGDERSLRIGHRAAE